MFCVLFTFQIKKCADPTCCVVKGTSAPRFMPMPVDDPNNKGHYLPFADAFRQQMIPDHSHIPSLRNETRAISVEQQGCPNSKLNKQNARGYLKCARCQKPRVIYSLKKLNQREDRALERIKRMYGSQYECGCILVPEGETALEGKVFTRVMMSCGTPVETPYFTSNLIKTAKDICRHCGVGNVAVEPELLAKHSRVIPSCQKCRAQGKDVLKIGKTAKL